MGTRVSHFAESLLSPGEPLTVDLELQQEERCHEQAPQGWMDGGSDVRWEAQGQEHAGYPWSKEEVNPHGVAELAPHRLEVEDAFQRVGYED